VVLTEDAAQAAAGKEDRTGAFCSRKTGLFPHVKADSRDPKLGGHPAKPGPERPVYTAVPGTEMAFLIGRSAF